MPIKPITNTYTADVSFKRALKPEEEKTYNKSISAAKMYLGIKNLALILHGSSFPIEDKDLFIGSPTGSKAAEVNDFLKMHGFDSIQLGPPGMIQRDDFSPYLSSIYSRNYLFTDMSKLVSAKLLSDDDINKFTNPHYINNANQTDFKAAFNAYDTLFEKAYDNMNEFSKNSDNSTKQAAEIKKEFIEFKHKNENWLESDALFEVLTQINGHDNYEIWDDTSKNFIKYLKDENHPKHNDAIEFKNKLYLNANTAKDIELYKFKQFLVKKQENEFAAQGGKLKYMSDAIIGFSPRDVWANQELFLKNYCIGCPYGGEGESIEYSSWGKNQIWDIPLVDPKSLFNSDGSIGNGGKLIQEKFRALLENHDNIRIDHVLGLVDPWVYDKTRVKIEKNPEGKIFHTIAYGANISMFGKPNAYKIHDYWGHGQKDIQHKINSDIERMPNIDPDGNYKRIIHEILLPVIKEKGLKTNDVAWENLGAPTDVFNEVCYGDNLKRKPGDTRDIIPGMSGLKSYQAQGEAQSVPDNYMIIQTHDNPHTGEDMTDDFYHNNQNIEKPDYQTKGCMDASYLIGTLYPDLPANADEEKGIKWEESKDYLINKKLPYETNFRTLVKWQELMRFGKNIQVTFMDFFGLGEVYNYSGTNNPLNWKLRLTRDYKDKYYETLERSKNYDGKDPLWWKHIAMNMPELLKRAVISKTMNEGKDLKTVAPLVNELSHWEKVLYEKTDKFSKQDS